MFDIGWAELVVIGVVALIVIGPRDLPDMFRTLGRFTAKARNMARDFQRAMEAAAKESGVKDVAKDLKAATSPKNLGLDAVKEAAAKFEKWDPLKTAPKPPGGSTGPAAGSATPGPAPAASAPGSPAPAAGPHTQALAEKTAERKAIIAEAAEKLKRNAAAPVIAEAATPKKRTSSRPKQAGEAKPPRKKTPKAEEPSPDSGGAA
jgi:sec-independent protein translocase protein TatB